MILAASSPFFQKLLERNNHTHPLIYMRGLKSENLNAILDFLYCGEANVFQESLDSFLAIAEQLKLKGLMEQSDANDEKLKEFKSSSLPFQMVPKAAVKSDQGFKSVSTNHQLMNINQNFEQTMAITRSATADLQELGEQVKSMMENSPNMIQNCKQQKEQKFAKYVGKRRTSKYHKGSH